MLLFLLVAVPVLAKEPIRIIDGTVVKVVDGDTIHVVDTQGSKVKIRLYGIDAPETEKSNRLTGRGRAGVGLSTLSINSVCVRLYRR